MEAAPATAPSAPTSPPPSPPPPPPVRRGDVHGKQTSGRHDPAETVRRQGMSHGHLPPVTAERRSADRQRHRTTPPLVHRESTEAVRGQAEAQDDTAAGTPRVNRGGSRTGRGTGRHRRWYTASQQRRSADRQRHRTTPPLVHRESTEAVQRTGRGTGRHRRWYTASQQRRSADRQRHRTTPPLVHRESTEAVRGQAEAQDDTAAGTPRVNRGGPRTGRGTGRHRRWYTASQHSALSAGLTVFSS